MLRKIISEYIQTIYKMYILELQHFAQSLPVSLGLPRCLWIDKQLRQTDLVKYPTCIWVFTSYN